MTVANIGGSTINAPIQVVFTNLTPGVTMVNNTGVRGSDPYITIPGGALAPGVSTSVSIQFTNPSNGFINFTPVTYSGAF